MPLLETKGAASAQGFGLTLGGEEPIYIEDVFSTYLYTGNGSTQTITNGIDLSGEGGLVWIKNRDQADSHILTDTARGAGEVLSTNATTAETTDADTTTAFNSDGFSIGADVKVNTNTEDYVSWTFRKAPKFFDVVTYTGTGANRTVAHDLGSIPGCIIVKRTDTTGDWQVYHRANTANPETDYLVLNSTAATADSNTRWNDTLPTATEFSLGTEATVNASGGTYVAYLFAHDAGGFGLSGSDNVISCGSFVGNNSTPVSVTLGWETQWLLVRATNGNNWYMFDTMRGFVASPGTSSKALYPNLSDAEASWNLVVEPTATGFSFTTNNTSTYIYIAIRRGPMKVPTSGTSVFSPINIAGTNTNQTITGVGFAPDWFLTKGRSNGGDGFLGVSRLTGTGQNLRLWLNNAEGTDANNTFDFNQSSTMDGGTVLSLGQSFINNSAYTYIRYFLRRAPGFFDEVCDTGTGSAHTITHNLGVAPELMIRKKRSAADNWIVYANNDPTDYLILNSTAATADLDTMWNDTAPTSTVFTVGTNDDVNQSTGTFVTYLFATCPGVSKVGSYTGTGTTLQIDCGFTGGARFVLIKRTDSTGSWYCWDSARGIVAGNDPYLLLNSTAAEVTGTDYIDTYSAGFEITSTAPAEINASGGTFVFLSIA